MIATHNQQTPKDGFSLSRASEKNSLSAKDPDATNVQNLNHHQRSLLPHRIITHHPKAGLNPLIDTAAYLFSVLGKLKYIKTFRHLPKLQKELIQEINSFQEKAKKYGYNNEYIIVCRYILCAAFDDMITNTTWGSHGQWDGYSLLSAFNQDTNHQDKFFTILERAIKEPSSYIDLMELMYICLTLGYKGHYHSTEHNQYQLEQITNNLYKHIRIYRGNFTKTLSPVPLKMTKPDANLAGGTSLLSVFFVTACINMVIFVSLGYLMDVISNEAYKNLTQTQVPISYQTTG